VADDEFTPLSESALWDLQRAYFEREGVQAWSSGTVPSMVSTNAVVAAAYAKLITAFLREWTDRAGRAAERVHIVELGAGAGRLGYHVVRKLAPRLAASPVLRDVAVRYVLTDLPMATRDWWLEHEQLQSLMESGQLDVAIFDAAAPAPLHLERSGTVLGRGSMADPLIVVANYVLDSLPQDAFSVVGGELFEHHAHVELHPATEPEATATPDDLRVRWQRRPVADDPRYADAELASLLEMIRAGSTDCSFLFPVTALRCLEYLRSLTTEPLLLLSADKGYNRPPEELYEDGPHIASHGSVSLMVDYSLVERHVRAQGGTALLPQHRPASLTVGAFVLADSPDGWPELQQTFDDVIGGGGPDDFFILRSVFEEVSWLPSLAQLLARLRSSDWDPGVFIRMYPGLMIMVNSVKAEYQGDVVTAADKVEELYFDIAEPIDMPFCLAMFRWRLGQFDDALRLLAWSERLHGPDAERSFAAALCQHGAGREAEALIAVRAAVEQDPTFEMAAEYETWLTDVSAGERDEHEWGAGLMVSVKAPDRRPFRRLPGFSARP
jgi:hypothetical protein